MTPTEYESYIGSIFAQKGYNVIITPPSNDWGLDIIAVKGNEKIGIQAKMYGQSNRCVNRRVIMELFGASAYQDCSRAILATDGDIRPDARQVADKLGIEIIQTTNNIIHVPKTHPTEIATKKNNTNFISFDEAWEKYIFPLRGKILSNSRGTNRITRVDWGGIERITSNGVKGKIDIEGFRLAYNVLIKKGHITRDYINQEVDNRRSSGIVLILGQIPFIEKTSSPTGLRLK